jgi:NADH-quinone oxidoreductase subunit A
MSDSGVQTYAPLVLHLLVAGILAGLITSLSVLIGWRRPNRAKSQAYECGMEPTGDAREPFSVKFYLVAMIFILFDVEAIFLYPWAVVFRTLGRYRLLRNDDLHRDPSGRLFLSLEKRRAGLA